MSIVTPKQIAKTMNLISDSNISGEQYQQLLESGKLTALLKEFIESGSLDDDILRVMLDYDMTLEQMIQSGHYDYAYEDITAEYFPVNKRESGEIDLRIIHFGYDMTTKEVIAELNKKGLRPAELPELLALGAACPDLQRKYNLVALGSQWQNLDLGRVDIPFLTEEEVDERNLRLTSIDSACRWDGDDRFVAVSK